MLNTCLRILPDPFSSKQQYSPISYLSANECYNTCLRVLPDPFSLQARVVPSFIFWQMNAITPASTSYLIKSLQARVAPSFIFWPMNPIASASASYLILFPPSKGLAQSPIFRQMNAITPASASYLILFTPSKSSPISYLSANECNNTCLCVLPNPIHSKPE